MKNPAPRFYLKWKTPSKLQYKEIIIFLVFSAFLIKSFNIHFFFFIYFVIMKMYKVKDTKPNQAKLNGIFTIFLMQRNFQENAKFHPLGAAK